MTSRLSIAAFALGAILALPGVAFAQKEKERNDQLTDFLSGLGKAIGPENARVLAAERRLREPP